jgi:hypothetical protein
MKEFSLRKPARCGMIAISQIKALLTNVPNRECDGDHGELYQKNFFSVSAGLVVLTPVDRARPYRLAATLQFELVQSGHQIGFF